MTARHSLSAPLSEELVAKYGVKRMNVRKGDTVMVVRGGFRGIEGKVLKVSKTNGRVFVEGVSRERTDGTTRPVSVHASKVVIHQLSVDDKRRREILERRVRNEVETERKTKREPKGTGLDTKIQETDKT
ncbi:MAG: 50S ribosomal protein L24 [Candidatus Bathyarchaeia archaeon]